MRGKLYGVGVGPGDPELLTLKAKNILESADVIAFPVRSEKETSRALQIITPVVNVDGKKIMPVIFSMSKVEEKRDQERKAAALTIQKE